MKILFIINDVYYQYIGYEHTGVLNAPRRRAIEIELTQEQVNQLALDEKRHEEIESVSVTLPPK